MKNGETSKTAAAATAKKDGASKSRFGLKAKTPPPAPRQARTRPRLAVTVLGDPTLDLDDVLLPESAVEREPDASPVPEAFPAQLDASWPPAASDETDDVVAAAEVDATPQPSAPNDFQVVETDDDLIWPAYAALQPEDAAVATTAPELELDASWPPAAAHTTPAPTARVARRTSKSPVTDPATRTAKDQADERAAKRRASEERAREARAAERRAADERAAARRAKAELDEAKRAAEELAAEKLAAEQLAAARLEEEKRATKRFAAEKRAAEKQAIEQQAAERRARAELAEAKRAAEALAAEKREAEARAKAELEEAKRAAEALAAEKAAAEERAQAELEEAKRAAEALAAEKAAAEARAKAELEEAKRAAEALAAEKAAAEQRAKAELDEAKRAAKALAKEKRDAERRAKAELDEAKRAAEALDAARLAAEQRAHALAEERRAKQARTAERRAAQKLAAERSTAEPAPIETAVVPDEPADPNALPGWPSLGEFLKTPVAASHAADVADDEPAEDTEGFRPYRAVYEGSRWFHEGEDAAAPASWTELATSPWDLVAAQIEEAVSADVPSGAGSTDLEERLNAVERELRWIEEHATAHDGDLPNERRRAIAEAVRRALGDDGVAPGAERLLEPDRFQHVSSPTAAEVERLLARGRA